MRPTISFLQEVVILPIALTAAAPCELNCILFRSAANVGGTTACVTAGRLAAADPSLKILLLEAGNHTCNVPEHVQPALFLKHLALGSTTATLHVGKPSEHLDGRAIIIPCAKAVGGGSSINYMMYTRAAASDYDDWESVHGNPGWSFAHLEPLFKKMEKYYPHPSSSTHGGSGQLSVSYQHMTNVGKDFLETAIKYDKTRGVVEDANDFKTVDGYARWAKWIDQSPGRRSDAAHAFIYNQSSNKNLQVRERSLVKRVIIKNGKAIGVEFVNDDLSLAQNVQTALASRMIVISAGAFGSPVILERPGIGARHILDKHNIECVINLPGVGENYRDHTALFIPCKASDEAETLDAIFRNDPTEMPRIMEQWNTTGTGLLAHNGCDAAVKLRLNSADLIEIGPTFTKQYHEHFENALDKPAMCIIPMSGFYGDQASVPPRKYFTMTFYTEYPVSTGRVHLSSPDVRAPLEFDSGFLSQQVPADLALLRWGYKRAREYARRMLLYRGELEAAGPMFAPSSGAAIEKESNSVDIDAPDIVYMREDDVELDAFIKKFVATAGHCLGTCAMKPCNEMGVVDCHLNVYGVQNLKVAAPDLSIAPSNVSANTCSTALVIGEKAAVIIAQELGIKLV